MWKFIGMCEYIQEQCLLSSPTLKGCTGDEYDKPYFPGKHDLI